MRRVAVVEACRCRRGWSLPSRLDSAVEARLCRRSSLLPSSPPSAVEVRHEPRGVSLPSRPVSSVDACVIRAARTICSPMSGAGVQFYSYQGRRGREANGSWCETHVGTISFVICYLFGVVGHGAAFCRPVRVGRKGVRWFARTVKTCMQDILNIYHSLHTRRPDSYSVIKQRKHITLSTGTPSPRDRPYFRVAASDLVTVCAVRTTWTVNR